MVALSASHRRAADSTRVSNTVLQIERRAADGLKNIGGRRLLLQTKFRVLLLKQPHIFDGNHGLIREGFH